MLKRTKGGKYASFEPFCNRTSDGNALYYIEEGIRTERGKHQIEGWKALKQRLEVIGNRYDCKDYS